MLVRRPLLLTSAVLLGGLMVAPPALAAAPPGNDGLTNATAIPSLPSNQTLVTTDATADADDNLAVTPCFPTATSHNSVWYSFAATTDTQLVVDAVDASFDPGVTIAAGDVHNQPAMNCTIGRTRTSMHIAAGQTATILVYDPSGGGGTIELKIFGAVAPPNDTAAAATPIGSLPFTDEQYVGLASSDADDDQVSQACGNLGPTPNSVWYTYTAGPGDGRVLFDTSKTTPVPGFGLVIATGSPGALTPVSCGPGVTAVDTAPGTTYLVMIFSGSRQADQFRFDVSLAPPPAAGTAHFDKLATVGRDGTAHLTGRYRCSNAAFFSASGSITQTSGRVTRRGAFGAPENPVCDGRGHRFQVSVPENEGRHFRPGGAQLEFSTTACDVLSCTFSLLTTQKITLVPHRPAR